MGSFFIWFLESSLLVLMILGIRRVFTGRIRYAGIYALWMVVLLRFLLPVNIISTPFSFGNVISEGILLWNQAGSKVQEESAVSDAQRDLQRIVYNISRNEADASGKLSQNEFVPGAAQDQSGMDVLQPQRNTLSEDTGDGGWTDFLICVWVIVSGSIFLWLLLSNVCLMRELERNRTFYGKWGRLSIYSVSGINTPCLYGFFRPVIYIPEILLQYGVEEEELYQMITHEYVHYCHGDHIWAMFRMLLVSLYWFDPFLWLAVSCSKKDAELFCDETVIKMIGEERRFSYGAMLVRLAGDVHWADFRYSMMPMSKRGKEMERRIRAISRRKKYSRWMLLPLFVVIAAAVGITCSAGVAPAKGESRAVEEIKKTSPGMTTGNGGDRKEEERGQQSDTWYQARGYQEELAAEWVVSETPQAAFSHYIEVFTEAVNTGRTDKMSQVLAVGSEVYEQQCALVKNYHKRGIREEVKNYSTTLKSGSESQKLIQSKEEIKVNYGDGTFRIVKQSYQYTCKKTEGGFIIIAMDEIKS